MHGKLFLARQLTCNVHQSTSLAVQLCERLCRRLARGQASHLATWEVQMAVACRLSCMGLRPAHGRAVRVQKLRKPMVQLRSAQGPSTTRGSGRRRGWLRPCDGAWCVCGGGGAHNHAWSVQPSPAPARHTDVAQAGAQRGTISGCRVLPASTTPHLFSLSLVVALKAMHTLSLPDVRNNFLLRAHDDLDQLTWNPTWSPQKPLCSSTPHAKETPIDQPWHHVPSRSVNKGDGEAESHCIYDVHEKVAEAGQPREEGFLAFNCHCCEAWATVNQLCNKSPNVGQRCHIHQESIVHKNLSIKSAIKSANDCSCQSTVRSQECNMCILQHVLLLISNTLLLADMETNAAFLTQVLQVHIRGELSHASLLHRGADQTS